jgi:hypothetical protein
MDGGIHSAQMAVTLSPRLIAEGFPPRSKEKKPSDLREDKTEVLQGFSGSNLSTFAFPFCSAT